MAEERRANAFCNLFELHCKAQFDEIKADIKAIKRVLMEGNGESLITQAKLNTEHRKWMESWGRGVLVSVSISSIALIAYTVAIHAK